MPGRVAARTNGRGAGASAASGTHSARSTSKQIECPDEGEWSELRERVCSAFAEAQQGNSTQRKSAVGLRKVQELCCYDRSGRQQHGLAGDALDGHQEAEFNNEICRCILRLLLIKKSEPVGDRLMRFLGFFLKHAADKDNGLFSQADHETLPETPTSRLVGQIVNLLIPRTSSKDKLARYRATQIISHILNTLDSLDEDLFDIISVCLLKRLRDKESAVRVQAVLGLGRLADDADNQDDTDDSDDGLSGGMLTKLLHLVQHDPSADVRRALLLNLPLTPATLPYLLERARDQDGPTRHALYSRLLPALGDFRHLSLTHREKLLRWGLRDRDEKVRKATARLFQHRWIEDCAATQTTAHQAVQAPGPASSIADPNLEALTELLERIDVVNSAVDSGIAHEAMKQFWHGRPDYRTHVTFADPYFDTLSAETVFVARSFNQYCRESGDASLTSLCEDKLPEATRLAFILRTHIAHLIQAVEKVALEPDDAQIEEDTVQLEFCVEQLLHMALTFDYSDEMGRRNMFSVMRESLALAELPEESTKLVVNLLRSLCATNAAGEQEFCSIVLEAVAEVHDIIMSDEQPAVNDDEDDSFHSARSALSTGTVKPPPANDSAADEAKAVREIMVNMKCLHIAQCMLQNVVGNLDQNSHLVTMLNNLVVPAVRSQEAPIRERGLVCLGLCCLLSKNLARENLTLFLHCFAKGNESLQVIAVQIIADLATMHPSLLAVPDSVHTPEEIEQQQLCRTILKMFSKSLRAPNDSVQGYGCIALAKLMLPGIIADPDLLKQLVLAYFDPETQSNPLLRQTLAYFLPVFCHSKSQHAEALAHVTVNIIHALAERAEDLDEDEDMIGLNLVLAQICDWIDPRKCVPLVNKTSRLPRDEYSDAHLVLAHSILQKILSSTCTREERKHYVSILPKLHMASTAPQATLEALDSLLLEALQSSVADETVTKNALLKLRLALTKARSGREHTEPAKPAQRSAAAQEPGIDLEDKVKAATEDQAEVGDEMEDEADIDQMIASDLTMLTGPDHEGTIFMDYDDEDGTEAGSS